MYVGVQCSARNGRHKKTCVALPLLLCFVALALLSSAFIPGYLEHEHDHNGIGGHCAVCLHFHQGSQSLKQFAMAATAVGIGLICSYAVKAVFYTYSTKMGIYSPVGLKIRMNH